MATALFGRIVGEKIELDEGVKDLDGKRVWVTIDVVEPGFENEHPVARAIRLAPLDDEPVTEEERAKVEASRRSTIRYTTAELRQRLAAARNPNKE